MTVWGLSRVKNESRYIERMARSMKTVCDQILIFDDHSTDGTPEICESLGCTVFRSKFDGTNEARDKDFLLEQVWKAGAQRGDMCLMLDGDETIFEPDLPLLKSAIERRVPCGRFKFLYLWDSEDQVRIDRWYSEFSRPSLFKLIHQNLGFQTTSHGGNLHCSSVPVQLLPHSSELNVRLVHWGYMDRETRIRKWNWYRSIDPDSTKTGHIEDGYNHMVIGDLFPADSVFKWAGPLQLAPIDIGSYKTPPPPEPVIAPQKFPRLCALYARLRSLF